MPHLLQQAVELCDLPIGQAEVGEHLLVQDLRRPFDRPPAGPGDDRQRRPTVGGMALALDQSLGLQPVDCARDARGMNLEADPELAERNSSKRANERSNSASFSSTRASSTCWARMIEVTTLIPGATSPHPCSVH